MTNTEALERAALDFHQRGIGWLEYWQRHANEARNAEPYNAQRFKRLVNRLLHLLTTGEPSGQYPPSIMEPWERADAQVQAADVGTQARCLFTPEVQHD